MIIKSAIHYFDYRQICIYICGIENPYNHWSKEEFDQGFAYRRESVSFRTTWTANDYEVFVEKDDDIIDHDAIIVIKVPFNVESASSVCISSVMDSNGDEISFSLPPGSYSLRYEAFPAAGNEEFEEVQKIRLVFNLCDEQIFEIIRNDGTLNVPSTLKTDGKSA